MMLISYCLGLELFAYCALRDSCLPDPFLCRVCLFVSFLSLGILLDFRGGRGQTAKATSSLFISSSSPSLFASLPSPLHWVLPVLLCHLLFPLLPLRRSLRHVVDWPDCGGGVTTNRSSVSTVSICLILWFILLIVFCYPTVCRVADERLALARASVLSDLHATCDVGAAAPASCSMRALCVWAE